MSQAVMKRQFEVHMALSKSKLDSGLSATMTCKMIVLYYLFVHWIKRLAQFLYSFLLVRGLKLYTDSVMFSLTHILTTEGRKLRWLEAGFSVSPPVEQ